MWHPISCVRLPDNGIADPSPAPPSLPPKPQPQKRSLLKKFCQYVFYACVALSLMCAQSQDCLGINPCENNLELLIAVGLDIGCRAPPAFLSLCSVKFFPFFIFPGYFTLPRSLWITSSHADLISVLVRK